MSLSLGSSSLLTLYAIGEHVPYEQQESEDYELWQQVRIRRRRAPLDYPGPASQKQPEKRGIVPGKPGIWQDRGAERLAQAQPQPSTSPGPSPNPNPSISPSPRLTIKVLTTI